MEFFAFQVKKPSFIHQNHIHETYFLQQGGPDRSRQSNMVVFSVEDRFMQNVPIQNLSGQPCIEFWYP